MLESGSQPARLAAWNKENYKQKNYQLPQEYLYVISPNVQ